MPWVHKTPTHNRVGANGLRAWYVEILLLGWVAAVSAQPGAEPPQTDGSSLELSDEQLQYFVENVGDFLYRAGGYLDDFNYELLKGLPSNASVWYEQANARLKYEAVALCKRADRYDSLGLAEELNRIGVEFDRRYSDRIRMELSPLSEDAAQLAREYVRTKEFRAPLRPWKVILDMAHDAPALSQRELADFVCKVANERL